MRFREFLIEGPVQDNQRALESYFVGDKPDLKTNANYIMEDYAKWMNLFTQIIKPNINPAVAGRYMNFWSTWGRYTLGSLYIDSMSDQGYAKFKKFLDKHDLPIEDERWTSGFTEDVQHFYNNTPYDSVKNWVPDRLMRVFIWDRKLRDMIEEEQANQSQVIDHSDENSKGIEPIDLPVKLPNGMKWFNLNRNYCDREGAAMGHCGNRAGYTKDETVLSLREPKGQNHWRPVCTFILDTSTGLLGERKGRANQKPTSEYHPAIMALLRYYDPIIGFEDKGYLQKNNFQLSDLKVNSMLKDLIKDLIKNKPLMLINDISIVSNTIGKDNLKDFEQYLKNYCKNIFGNNIIVNIKLKKLVLLHDNGVGSSNELYNQIMNNPNAANDLIKKILNDKSFKETFDENYNPIIHAIMENLKLEGDPLDQVLEQLGDKAVKQIVDLFKRDLLEKYVDSMIEEMISEDLRYLTSMLLDGYIDYEILENNKPYGISALTVDLENVVKLIASLKNEHFVKSFKEFFEMTFIPSLEKQISYELEFLSDQRIRIDILYNIEMEGNGFIPFVENWLRKHNIDFKPSSKNNTKLLLKLAKDRY